MIEGEPTGSPGQFSLFLLWFLKFHIQSFNKYSLSACYGLGTVLSTNDIAVNKRANTLAFLELEF